MMIKAKSIITKERTWINRVAQRDVTNVNRSGEWFNMESRNLVPGDLVKLTLGGLISADCVGREIWTRPRLLKNLSYILNVHEFTDFANQCVCVPGLNADTLETSLLTWCKESLVEWTRCARQDGHAHTEHCDYRVKASVV